MNIAILITGKLRRFHDLKQNINFLFEDIENVNLDYFCTTNFELDVDFKSLQDEFDFKILDVESYDENTIQFIKDANNFINFVENYKNEDPDYICFAEQSRKENVWYHMPVTFHKLNRGIRLIENYQIKNNKKYDIIIRIRWDTFFKNKFKKDHLLECKDSNFLYVYKHSFEKYLKSIEYNESTVSYQKFVDDWIDEMLFYGNYKTMNIFKEIYNCYFDIAIKNNVWITHKILKIYLDIVNIQSLNPDVKIGIMRKDRLIHIFNYL